MGALIVYLILEPRLKKKITLDEKTLTQNHELSKEQVRLSTEVSGLKDLLLNLNENLTTTQKNLDDLTVTYNNQKETQSQTLQDYYQEVEKRYRAEVELNRQNYINEYNKILEDSAAEYALQYSAAQEELQQLAEKMRIARSEVDAALAYNKRRAEAVEKESYYRLQIDDVDLQEIEKLKEVGKTLRDPVPLNKVIWKVYYENAYTDLVGRVLGTEQVTGIYKITEVASGRCYVGRATSMAKRWKEHLQCGVGATISSNNKLYPAMQKLGVQNFTFELIEQCKEEDLDAREDYWQKYFGAMEFGYSIK